MSDPHNLDDAASDLLQLELPEGTIGDLDAARLVDALLEAGSQPCPELAALATTMGAPAEDCLATVLSARATVMAAARGRAFYRHELRGRIPMPPGMGPETEVWDAGTVPVWEDGVFNEPKYFSFRQDAPFAAYNSVHRKKWRPHELLHGAVGFFYRPDMTRFEVYVGARLNELLPVVHWYELDEIFRPRCERHRGGPLFRDWCADCEAAVRPYWEAEGPHDRDAAIQLVRSGQDHFFREMEACRTEITTGRTREAANGRLNSSSDAVGYLLGHWPRMSAWSFRTWADLFLREGVDYFDDLSVFADRVESCASQLLGGTVNVSPARFEALRQRRTLQDIAYRALIALEWIDGPAAEAVSTALEGCADAVDDTASQSQQADAVTTLLATLHRFRDAFPEEVADPLLAMGLHWFPEGRDPDWELRNLAEGVSQAAPFTGEHLEAAHLETFAAHDAFVGPGRLVTRFAAYLRDAASEDLELAPIAELASIEAWAAEDPRRDEEAERFAHPLPREEDCDPADLRPNRTLRRAVFGADTAREFLDLETSEQSVELLGAYWRGEFHIAVVDASVRATLAAVEAGQRPDVGDTLLALVEAGLIAWLPAPGRQKTSEQ